MRIPAIIAAAALALSGCVQTTAVSTAYPENVQTTQCFTGQYAFSFFVDLPREYGQIYALTQHESSSRGLTSVCRLVRSEGGGAYDAFTGEVSNGNSGMCISARTQNAGHVMSCASRADVRRAINAPAGSSANTLDFSRWTQYPG